MALPDENLDPQQEHLILALLSERTKEAAAAKAGVARRTMYRWLENPVFMSAYRRARHLAFDEAVAALEKAAKAAADTLSDIITAEKTMEDADTRIKAAKAILDYAFRAYETIGTDERIADLERRYAALITRVKAA